MSDPEINAFFKDLGCCPTHQEIDHTKDSPARRAEGNVRLVVSVAKEWAGRGLPLMILIQEGTIGLMKAIRGFKPEKGYQFSTYAWPAIRRTIAGALEKERERVRNTPPTQPLHTYVRIERPEEGWDTSKEEKWAPLREIISDSSPTIECECSRLVADPPPSPEQTVFEKERQETITAALGSLPPRDREIIELRFGLKDGREHSLSEIGEIIGRSPKTVSQIEGKALRKLRRPFIARQLIEFLEY